MIPQHQMTYQAQTVFMPHRVPLVTMFGNRDEELEKDSKLINCHVEKIMGTDEYFIGKRVGLHHYSQVSGNGYGIYNWNDDLYSIFGSSLYKNAAVLGTIDTSGGRYRFVQVKGAPDRLVFGNGVKAYYTDGTIVSPMPEYSPVAAGSFIVGKSYTVITPGDTDWVACGAVAAPNAPVTTVRPGHFVVGTAYIIHYLGTHKQGAKGAVIDWTFDFTTVGATENIVGLYFVATGVGAPKSSNCDAKAYLASEWTATTFTATNAGVGTGRAALNVGSMTVGTTYQIFTVETTDFTQIGAASNTVGLTFIYTDEVATASGTGTVLPESGFPQEFCKGWAYLDGTLYVMDPKAHIWGSKYLDDPTQWDPLNFLTANIEPDKGIALAKQLAYVVALKEWTTEVFYDAGNAVGSPLARVPGAKSPYGCVAADSVQEIDDVLYWVSSNRTVSPQIVRMKDLKVEVISIPPVERMLDQADFTEVFSWNFKHGGHRFYGVTIKNENLTLVYDVDQEWWYLWTDANGDYWPIVGETFSPIHLHIAQHESNGKLFLLEGDYQYPSDDGDVVPVDIYTPLTDFGVDRRKVLKVMRFNGDKKDGSMLQVRVTDDDYQTWSNYRQVDMSKKRPILTDCGTFYRRAWHIRHYANTPFRIRSIDLQMDIGTL